MASAQGSNDNNRLLDTLRACDQALSKAFTLSVDIRSTEPTIPFLDERQGIVNKKCTLTRIGDERGLTTLHRYGSAPIFAIPGEHGYHPGDYDEQGNLIVWRILEKYSLFTDKVNNRLEVRQSNRVNSESLVVRAPTSSVLYIYPPGDENYFFEFQRLLLAVGRGVSSQIISVTEVRLTDSGLLDVEAAGTKPTGGTWKLSIDPAADYLIRRASLITGPSKAPSLVTSTSGRLTSGGSSVAQRGRVGIPMTTELTLEEEVTVTSFANQASESDLDGLRNRVAGPALPNMEVVDLRPNVSQGIAPAKEKPEP
jgi:hypothetical protein